MPVATYSSGNRVNRQDFKPDPSKIHVWVDPKTRIIMEYKTVLNPQTDQYEKVFTGVTRTPQEAKEARMGKGFSSMTVEERKKQALQNAANAGVIVNGVNPASGVSLQCRCGFEATDDVEMFRHKVACTFVKDQVIAEQQAELDKRKAEEIARLEAETGKRIIYDKETAERIKAEAEVKNKEDPKESGDGNDAPIEEAIASESNVVVKKPGRPRKSKK